ncbi:transposase, MuDR, MULE transposase domain protein [Tanacetum coccineum]
MSHVLAKLKDRTFALANRKVPSVGCDVLPLLIGNVPMCCHGCGNRGIQTPLISTHLRDETLGSLNQQFLLLQAFNSTLMAKVPFNCIQIDSNFTNENDPREYSLNIDDFDLHLTHVLRSSSSAHVEPSPYTPNPATIIPDHAGVVQLSNSICVEPSSSTPNPVRIILGPAGLQKVIEDVGDDADFTSGAWVSATNYVNAFGGTVTGCLGDINNFLKKGKLKQVVAIVKSCSPNALGDLNVTLKDLSGTVPGTINYKVLDVGSYGKDITVGAAMILANVSVFIPKPSKHYLNITKRNVVEVFRKDTVLGSGSG